MTKMKFRASIRLYNGNGDQVDLIETIGNKEECRQYVGYIHRGCKRFPKAFNNATSFTWEVIPWQAQRTPGKRVAL